jgi:hypothetical protein
MTNKDKIIAAFHNVKKMGWVKSHRKNNTGIGKTFEDCIGVLENNLNKPDLFGFEIKTHRISSNAFVTLFTKKPSYPPKANEILKDKFGETDPRSGFKKLHTSIWANKGNNFKDSLSFKLINKPDEEKIYISIMSLPDNKLLDCSSYYTYDDIKVTLTNKLHNLLYVSANNCTDEDGNELFLFDSAEIYTNPSLNKFLQLIDDGEIMYDIRIGTYRSGKLMGKAHDHGSGFRIRMGNLTKLYDFYEKIS